MVGIALVAALLGGVVALNVALLRLRMEEGKVQADVVKIRTENTAIRSQISSAAAVSRVEGAARRLGLVQPSQTTYLTLPRSAR